MAETHVIGAVRNLWQWFRPANRIWLGITAATALVFIGLSGLPGIRDADEHERGRGGDPEPDDWRA
jgi:hypothetical protein